MATSKNIDFDPYFILGLTIPCSDSDIDKAYKKAALKWHPDKAIRNGISKEDSEKRFGQIYQAYQFLKDESLRETYDEEVANKKRRKEYEEERRATSSARRQGFEDKLKAREEVFESRKRKNQASKASFNFDKELERLKKEGAAYLAKIVEQEHRKAAATKTSTVPQANLPENESIYHISADKLRELEEAELEGL
ncbi:unnamed protein product [Bursaphelenchus xylophilus]|uniref:(pine wood nematode) hypothetical protein n=1 Tax=Bursaphelenchus xylophilus TaxID=6326 RepID=A0A1I7S726_BURXY|nr:unnamed protein product [Bursaphelenchus xylophilus]CAG9084523.1 unnamed protein product [Bursaphelenchus xylophilus]